MIYTLFNEFSEIFVMRLAQHDGYLMASRDYVCVGCKQPDLKDNFTCTRISEMIHHVEKHVEIGDKVPDDTLKQLLWEQELSGET